MNLQVIRDQETRERPRQDLEKDLEEKTQNYGLLKKIARETFLAFYRDGDVTGCGMVLTMIRSSRNSLHSELDKSLRHPDGLPAVPESIQKKAELLESILDDLIAEMELALVDCGPAQ